MIKKLNSKGSELEAEQEAAMKEFEANALRHREEREAVAAAPVRLKCLYELQDLNLIHALLRNSVGNVCILFALVQHVD